MSTKKDPKDFIIEQLDEALEERQTPERRRTEADGEFLSHEDRRKADRRAQADQAK